MAFRFIRFNAGSISLSLKLNKVPTSIQRRVFEFLEMEWLDNGAYVLAFERNLFESATPKLRKELNAERLTSLIREIELFHDIDEDCLKEIASICKLILLPPQEVVGYRGHDGREMYIVEKGHCQMWRNIDMTSVDVGPGKEFWVVEMLCGLKNIHTVTTVTHVSIVQIKLGDLMRVLSQFPTQKAILTNFVKKFKKSPEVRDHGT